MRKILIRLVFRGLEYLRWLGGILSARGLAGRACRRVGC